MKKVFLLLILAVATFTLFGCNSSEYKVDGEFLAYEASVSHNAPQVVMVSVTIEDGEIVGYNIDTRQGNKVQNADESWTFSWKDDTKKELGDDYGMATEEGQLEWFEQAEALEAHWLENGVSIDEVDAEGNTDAVAGVTITVDTYYELALDAIDLAKLGKFQAVYCSADDLVSASMIVNSKGEASELVLDVLQGSPTGETFAFRDKTKQELGLEYGMKDSSEIGKEWYEQAEAIAAYVLENGADSIQVDDTGHISNITGASVRNSGYSDVFALLFDFANYEV